MLKKGKLLIFLIVALFLFSSSVSFAHDMEIPTSFEMSLGDNLDLVHEDQDPWKGTLKLTISNTGQDPWGDFHFYALTDNVIFTNEILPVMTGADFYTYSIDPDQQGLNFFFYDDPVLTDESVTFSLYTDNTYTQNSMFSIGFEPSPVPIPGAVWLLGTAMASVVALRRKNYQ